jgi:hypothetical protein
MKTTAHAPHCQPSRLWARAAELIGSLIRIIGSPAILLRNGETTRKERREIGFMIAPIEALVRSLLMSEAIAWLIGTDEGAEMLRNARRAPAQPAPEPEPKRAASAARTSPPDDPPTDESDPAEIHVIAGSRFTNAELKAYLAPAHLGLEVYDIIRSGRVLSTARPAATGSPRRDIRRPPPNLTLARRIETLRRIIADPRSAILIVARDLATRNLDFLYVPSPRNWIDERWPDGRGDVYAARHISWTRFLYLEQTRNRIDTLALPKPEPG